MENNEQSVWVTDVYGQWIKIKMGSPGSPDAGNANPQDTVPTIDKQVGSK